MIKPSKTAIKRITTILILSLTLFTSPTSQQTQQYTPISVVQLIRNGVAIPKTDSSLNLEFLTENQRNPLEHLEENGIRMLYLLGSEMRRRYKDLLTTQHTDATKVYSASSDKSVQSAYAYLMGLYPPGTGHKFSSNNPEIFTKPPIISMSTKFVNESVLPHQATVYPIEVVPSGNDPYFHNFMMWSCPGYFNEVEKNVQKSPPELPVKLVETIYGFMDVKNQVTGVPFLKSFEAVEAYYWKFGKYPKAIDEHTYQMMKLHHTDYLYSVYFRDEKNVKIFTSKISQYVLEVFQGAIEYGHFEPKFTVFSEQGMNIFAYMLAFQLTTKKCIGLLTVSNSSQGLTPECQGFPQFGSSITFELSKTQNAEHFVQTLFNGKPIDFCLEKKSVDDQNFRCPFDSFMAKINEFIDFTLLENKCVKNVELVSDLEELKEDTFYYRLGAVIGICLSSFFLLCIIVECAFRKRDKAMIQRTLERYKEKTRTNKSEGGGSTGSIELQNNL